MGQLRKQLVIKVNMGQGGGENSVIKAKGTKGEVKVLMGGRNGGGGRRRRIWIPEEEEKEFSN